VKGPSYCGNATTSPERAEFCADFSAMKPSETSRCCPSPVVRRCMLRENGFRAYLEDNPTRFGGAPLRALRLCVIHSTAPCAPYAAPDARGAATNKPLNRSRRGRGVAVHAEPHAKNLNRHPCDHMARNRSRSTELFSATARPTRSAHRAVDRCARTAG